jgi:hypothetical protein
LGCGNIQIPPQSLALAFWALIAIAIVQGRYYLISRERNTRGLPSNT